MQQRALASLRVLPLSFVTFHAIKENNVFAVESLILTGLIALAVGIGLGVVLGRRSGSITQQRHLEQNLASVKQELNAYQQDVARHFMETAQKVGELSQSYRDLNQHLAEGAMRLTSTEITKDMIAASDNRLNNPLDLSGVEPPKDWAPKIPGSHGMLSEEFGLKDQDEDAAPAGPHTEPLSAAKSNDSEKS